MKCTTSRLALVGALLLCGLFATPANAQATRTWISGTGDDANPCSRTSACKTFAGAISKTAPGGEIDALDPGGFGAITITKAITFDGGGGQVASILVAGTNGINVTAGANDVVILRNLAINGTIGNASGSLNGIQFNSGAALSIEHVTIFGFGGIGVEFVPSASAQLFMKDVSIVNCITGGIQLKPSVSLTVATLDNVRSDHNGYGLLVNSGSKAIVRNSEASDGAYGVLASLGTIDIEHSGLIGNQHAVYAEAGSTIYLSDDTISGNSVGLLTAGTGQIVSLGNNTLLGNTTPGAPTSTVPLK